MAEYTTLLEDMFSKLIKQYNHLQLGEYTNDTISHGNDLIMNGITLLKLLKSHCTTLETLLSDCSDFVKELLYFKEQPDQNSIYVYKSKNNILLYPSKTSISNIIDVYEADKKKKKIKKPQPVSNESRVIIPDIGYRMKLPLINNINDIPPAMYYHEASKGVYIRLPNNNVFRIPFPEVIDSRKDYSRKQSIRCKYKVKDECDEQRCKMASLYNSQVRTCNFAHKGDKLVKIGYQSRCPSVPSYGNLENISEDIKLLNDGDIKSLLLYGLNDIFMAALWMDYVQLKNKIIHNLCDV